MLKKVTVLGASQKLENDRKSSPNHLRVFLGREQISVSEAFLRFLSGGDKG